MNTPDLCALVSARLCHDLISPVGAVGNGIELLQMSTGPVAGSPELELVSDSVENALARLRFYRLAFGQADPEARLTLEEVAAITSAMYSGRFTIDWSHGPKDMPRTTGRMIYLAILCLEKSLPMGGLARVSMAEDTVTLSTDAARTAPPETLWAHVTLGAPHGELRPADVQFPLLRRALDDLGQRLVADFSGTGAEVSLTVPVPQPA